MYPQTRLFSPDDQDDIAIVTDIETAAKANSGSFKRHFLPVWHKGAEK